MLGAERGSQEGEDNLKYTYGRCLGKRRVKCCSPIPNSQEDSPRNVGLVPLQ